jgi:hypothetical protein
MLSETAATPASDRDSLRMVFMPKAMRPAGMGAKRAVLAVEIAKTKPPGEIASPDGFAVVVRTRG